MDANALANQQFITQNVIPPMLAYGMGGGRTAYIVSLYPTFEDTIGRFGEELPWTWGVEVPYGGKTIVRMPAALKGKNVWRKIRAEKLCYPTQPTEEDLRPANLAKNGGIWYYEDRVTPLKDPKEYGYSVLQIFDALHWSLEPFQQMNLVPQRVSVESFARDGLVLPWTNGMRIPQSGGKIGLGYCFNETEIPKLVEELKVAQRSAFIALVNEAHSLDRQRKNDQITDFYRIAFDWLGLDATQVGWRMPFHQMQKNTKPCLLCNSALEREAIQCEKCGLLPIRYLDAIDSGIHLEVPKDDPIRKHMDSVLESRKSKEAAKAK